MPRPVQLAKTQSAAALRSLQPIPQDRTASEKGDILHYTARLAAALSVGLHADHTSTCRCRLPSICSRCRCRWLLLLLLLMLLLLLGRLRLLSLLPV